MKGYWVVKVNVLHPDKQKLYAEYATGSKNTMVNF